MLYKNIQIIFLVVSFLFSAFLGKITIPLLKKLKVGQNERKEGPRSHLKKQGTPTMGRNNDSNDNNSYDFHFVFAKF